ncbi:MAG: sulfatase family protein [Planctomycetota bacterium]
MPTCVLIALLLAACGPPPVAKDDAPFAGQDCLVIVLDALHAGQLGCYGGRAEVSPGIDALAARGLRFANARSNSSWTLPSTATLFTGLYAGTHGLEFDENVVAMRLADHADTLAELFAAAGYRTVYAGQNPFAGAAYGLEQGFLDYESYRIWTDDMIEGLERRLAEPRDGPTFTYVHLRRPHTPYNGKPEHQALFVQPDYDGTVEGSDEEIHRHNSGKQRLRGADLQHMQALYLANIRQADAWVARLLASVDASRTLILLTSDHGEAVGQHGTLGHNRHTWEEYVHIPLILVHPSLPRGEVVQAPLSTVDVMPTLIELFGLPRPGQEMQGRSLARAVLGEVPWPEAPVFARSRTMNDRHESSIIDGRWKYTRTEPDGRDHLYDLVQDPSERRNLAGEHPDLMDRLREALRAWHAAQRPGYASLSDGLDEETRQQLEELGYVR